MEKYEIVIVGAGPGGLRAAEVLAARGKQVLVLEKNKIIGDKVCAGGLTLKDLKLGLPDKILQKKFNKIIIHTPHQDTELKVEEPFIATINRKDLGKWQENQARKQGAEIRTSSCVTKIDKNSVTVNNEYQISYKYLIGADGSNSIVRKFLNIPTENFEQAFHYITPKKFKELEIFIDPDKFSIYLWIFPYKNSTSIGTGADLSKHIKQPVFNLKVSEIRKNLDNFCKKKFDIKKAIFQAHIINYDYRGHEFGNKFLIGDAAGFTLGLTGEGIYSAIKSGEDVANKIINKKYNCINIRHILRDKKFEEEVLRSSEINRTLTKLEINFFVFLLKLKWLNKEILSLMTQ